MKTRVLHVGLSDHLGGIETYLYKITSYIDRNKYQFDFLIFDDIVPCYYDELSDLGCAFYRVTGRKNNFIKNRKQIETLLKRESFDVIHCHQNSLSYIVPIVKALKYDKKVIVHSHNADLNANLFVKMRHSFNYYILLKRDVKRVAVSDLAGEWMFGSNKEVVVLNNGLDTEIYKYNEQGRREIREEFEIGERELILHTGAFRTQKNHDFLLDIFAAYKVKEPDSVLMLVGEGELKEVIEEKVRKLNLDSSVIFTGIREDIPKILSAADKYLFPSLYEGFPNALIEAETSGLYCVVSDSITNQAIIEGITVSVPLDASIDRWVTELLKEPLNAREKCAITVREKGLDISSEINKLCDLYAL